MPPPHILTTVPIREVDTRPAPDGRTRHWERRVSQNSIDDAVLAGAFKCIHTERITEELTDNTNYRPKEVKVKEQHVGLKQDGLVVTFQWQNMIEALLFGPPGSENYPHGTILGRECWTSEFCVDLRPLLAGTGNAIHGFPECHPDARARATTPTTPPTSATLPTRRRPASAMPTTPRHDNMVPLSPTAPSSARSEQKRNKAPCQSSPLFVDLSSDEEYDEQGADYTRGSDDEAPVIDAMARRIDELEGELKEERRRRKEKKNGKRGGKHRHRAPSTIEED